jgi:hypothetical protein
MAIEFAFGVRSVDPAVRGLWYELYTKLNETEKHLFNNILPVLMLSAGLNHISVEMIPHLLARLALMDALRGGRPWTTDLAILHVLAVHGEEAADKFKAAHEAADKLIEESLPPGFKPDPAKALERFVGYVTNIQTETSQEFLSSLTKLRLNPFPRLTAAESLKEDRAYRAFAKDVASEAVPHPALSEEAVTA